MEKFVDEVKEMGRQIPKNVRQIGNVSDSSKIYIEDYVDIFLNQLCEKTVDKFAGAFLVGEVVETEEADYIYVNGAINMQNLVVKGKDFIIEEIVWKNACETCKEFFGDSEILGWVIVGGEQPFEMTHQIQKMHQKFFRREKSLVISKNRRDKEEKIYIYKYKEMLEAKGHYIYYEKNEEMQEYMIHCRKNVGMTPSEVIDDKAAKSFRSIIQEKVEKKEKKTKSRSKMAYVASLCCMILIFGSLGKMYVQRDEEEPVEEVVVDNEQPQIEVSEMVSKELEDTIETLDVPEVPEVQEIQEVVQPDAEIQMEEVYIVQKGDTLAGISKQVYGDILHVTEICELNGLENGNLIFIGQKLLLP